MSHKDGADRINVPDPMSEASHLPSKQSLLARYQAWAGRESAVLDFPESMFAEADEEIDRLTRGMNGQADVMVAREREFAAALKRLDELERANVGLATESDRLRAALDNLVGAVGALSDPEDQLSCIPAGPEAEELWQAWKDGEAALSGEPNSAPETPANPDTARLDWLDTVTDRMNRRYGTVYGWRYDINHNRAALTNHNLPALTIRQAIDECMATARAPEQPLKAPDECICLSPFDTKPGSHHSLKCPRYTP